MYYQTELYNLKNKSDADFFVDLAETCTKRSEWTLTSGIASKVFLDIDKAILHPQKSKELVDRVSKKISELLETGYLFDKIGFIEKAEGTVGLVTLMSSILININLLGILIRPKKRIFQDAIKGELLKGESILIISDLATSGITLFNAAKIVREHGGIVNYSMVVIDRLQGATENLARKGIQLFSLVSLKSLNETKRIQEYDIKEPVFQDFGGKSVTLVR